MANKLKHDSNKNPAHPISPIVHILEGSSPTRTKAINKTDGIEITDETINLFDTQPEDVNQSINPSEKSILKEIDEVEAMGEELERSISMGSSDADLQKEDTVDPSESAKEGSGKLKSDIFICKIEFFPRQGDGESS